MIRSFFSRPVGMFCSACICMCSHFSFHHYYLFICLFINFHFSSFLAAVAQRLQTTYTKCVDTLSVVACAIRNVIFIIDIIFLSFSISLFSSTLCTKRNANTFSSETMKNLAMKRREFPAKWINFMASLFFINFNLHKIHFYFILWEYRRFFLSLRYYFNLCVYVVSVRSQYSSFHLNAGRCSFHSRILSRLYAEQTHTHTFAWIGKNECKIDACRWSTTNCYAHFLKLFQIYNGCRWWCEVCGSTPLAQNLEMRFFIIIRAHFPLS